MILHDIRVAVRRLLKAPGFSTVTIASLALGIGACTLVFSWIRTVLIDTIPGAREPGRLVVLANLPTGGEQGDTLSLPDIRDLGMATNIYAGVIGSQIEATTLRVGREIEWVWAQTTTANFFQVLGVPAALGRTFAPDEDRAARGNPVTVISHRLWQRRFEGSPDVVGRVIEIGRRPFTIVGVAPEAFPGTMGGLAFDLWIPVTMSSEFDDIAAALDRRDWRWLHTIGRLRDGVSLREAQAGTDLVMSQLAAAYPRTNSRIGARVLPVWKAPWGAQGKFLPLLAALAAVAILLLGLVVANVSNLMIARAGSREGEMAVRLALGAGSARLMRQVLIECLVLAAVGGLAGTLLATGFSRGLLWLLPPTYLPIRLDFPVDARILLFASLTTALAGVLFGLLPAWRATRTPPAGVLKAGGRGSDGSPATQRLRQVLVVAEIAAACVLLIGMTLCARSFEQARKAPVGMDPDSVWIAGYRIPPGVMSREEAAAFYRRLVAELQSLPGVESVALADWLPLGFEGGSGTSFSIPGYAAMPGEWMHAHNATVTPGYFRTLRVPMLRGREFDDRDVRGSPLVVIVNEALARRYFPDREALGREIAVWGEKRTIVGVAATGKYYDLNEAPQPFVWFPLEQIGDFTLTAILRTRGHPGALQAAVEQASVNLDPHARPVAGMALTTYMAAAYFVPRTAAVLLAVLGASAVFLSALGIAGVISWSVNRRYREVGVRMALGALPQEVTWLFVRQALRLTAAGSALGILGGIAGGRGIAGILVGVSPLDLPTFLTALPALALVAVLAAWLPARRAAAIDPIIALRAE